MTPLPSGGDLVVWRLDEARFASSWNSGEGAYRVGGRWNSVGRRAVYCSVDPATAILEVAVHKGFRTLDTVAHVLTAIRIAEPARIHVVQPGDVPNPNWLRPGIPSPGQQAFGDDKLHQHRLVLIPSAVSVHSWNLVFIEPAAGTDASLALQERFALDTRLHPPTGAPSPAAETEDKARGFAP